MNKIAMAFVGLFLTLVLVATAQASPFVVSGPYPLEANLTDSDPVNPDTFIMVLDNGSEIIVAPTFLPAPDGRLYFQYDVALLAKGKHVMRIKAVHSVWGESVDVPFTFRAGTPVPVSGVKLQK